MNRRVLICDDNEGILEVISTTLSMFGFHVIVQQHSMQVLDDVVKYNPDLIILDLWMPILDGESLTRKLKENFETQNIPVLIISASWDGRDRAEKVNADGFIAKPFNIHDLLYAVKNCISN